MRTVNNTCFRKCALCALAICASSAISWGAESSCDGDSWMFVFSEREYYGSEEAVSWDRPDFTPVERKGGGAIYSYCLKNGKRSLYSSTTHWPRCKIYYGTEASILISDVEQDDRRVFIKLNAFGSELSRYYLDTRSEYPVSEFGWMPDAKSFYYIDTAYSEYGDDISNTVFVYDWTSRVTTKVSATANAAGWDSAKGCLLVSSSCDGPNAPVYSYDMKDNALKVTTRRATDFSPTGVYAYGPIFLGGESLFLPDDTIVRASMDIFACCYKLEWLSDRLVVMRSRQRNSDHCDYVYDIKEDGVFQLPGCYVSRSLFGDRLLLIDSATGLLRVVQSHEGKSIARICLPGYGAGIKEIVEYDPGYKPPQESGIKTGCGE